MSMTDFGIFYPRGHIVAAFRRREEAEKVRNDLLAGGYDPEDVVLLGCEEVAEAARQNLEDHRGMIARLGKSDEAVRRHLQAAEKGASFLLIYAPGDLDSERAMNVMRRVPFAFAHRYRRFAIQTLE